MRIRIDADRCQGHQMCAVVAPELFGSDDFGNATILIEGAVPPELEAKARRGAGTCPEQAVIIED